MPIKIGFGIYFPITLTNTKPNLYSILYPSLTYDNRTPLQKGLLLKGEPSFLFYLSSKE